jgi:hypothetical protein
MRWHVMRHGRGGERESEEQSGYPISVTQPWNIACRA